MTWGVSVEASRRTFLMTAAGLGAGVLVGCTPTSHPGPLTVPTCGPPTGAGAGMLPVPGSPGLVDEALFGARVDEYLALCTDHLSPTSPANVLAHLTRSRRDPTHVWDPTAVPTTIAPQDTYVDTSDFTLMYLQWVLREGRGVLPGATIEAIEDSIAGFRYRYDDPLPAGVIDDKWSWSENHRIIFAVDEYLGGLALPERVFTITGLTGAEHAERALPRIHQWIDERGRYGFSEWHSNVYLKFDFLPLLTLVEYTPDDDLRRLAAAMLDVVLFDIAAHVRDGAFGVTHGRTYKKDKMSSLRDSTFNSVKAAVRRHHPRLHRSGRLRCGRLRGGDPLSPPRGAGAGREQHRSRSHPRASRRAPRPARAVLTRP